MNYLRCTRCRQRFFTAATRHRILARCEFCGGKLGPIERPEERPPYSGPGDDRPPLPLARPSLVRADPGSYPDEPGSYPSLIEFVRSDRTRLYSRERDFGLSWRDAKASYRAAWTEDTGELYIVQLGPPDRGGGHVQLLAAGATFEQVEGALSGWQDIVHDPDSLTWLRDRVRRDLKSQALEPSDSPTHQTMVA